MGKSKEHGSDIFHRLEQGSLARSRMIENATVFNPVLGFEEVVKTSGNRLLQQRLTRLFLAGSAVGLAISLNFGVGDSGIVNAQDKTSTPRPTGTPTEKSTPTPTKTATATVAVTVTAMVTVTKTPTPNSIAARIAAQQTRIADQKTAVALRRNLRDAIKEDQRLEREEANLQAEIDALDKITDLEQKRNALSGSKKWQQEMEDLENEISALLGTPTRTPTPTSSPTVTPTLTREQIEIKQKAGLWPTNTPAVSPTRTPTIQKAPVTPESGGGGLPWEWVAGIVVIGSGLYITRRRVGDFINLIRQRLAPQQPGPAGQGQGEQPVAPAGENPLEDGPAEE